MAPVISEIVLAAMSKHYGAASAVDGISLRVAGTFLVLPGPSGCGKCKGLRA